MRWKKRIKLTVKNLMEELEELRKHNQKLARPDLCPLCKCYFLAQYRWEDFSSYLTRVKTKYCSWCREDGENLEAAEAWAKKNPEKLAKCLKKRKMI